MWDGTVRYGSVRFIHCIGVLVLGEEGSCILISKSKREITNGMLVTYCSGARKASVAVWGSLKEQPSLLKGMWVSPEVVYHGT